MSSNIDLSGGSLNYTLNSAGVVVAANIKASGGLVCGLEFFNNSATIAYVRLYDQTTTPGTGDTPAYRAMIPANTSGAGYVVPLPKPQAFFNGIGIRVTAGAADNDNTALGTNTVYGNVRYN